MHNVHQIETLIIVLLDSNVTQTTVERIVEQTIITGQQITTEALTTREPQVTAETTVETTTETTTANEALIDARKKIVRIATQTIDVQQKVHTLETMKAAKTERLRKILQKQIFNAIVTQIRTQTIVKVSLEIQNAQA